MATVTLTKCVLLVKVTVATHGVLVTQDIHKKSCIQHISKNNTNTDLLSNLSQKASKFRYLNLGAFLMDSKFRYLNLGSSKSDSKFRYLNLGAFLWTLNLDI